VTPDEVREFQSSHVDPLGAALKQDGDLGPKTRWALDLFSCSPRRRLIVHRAQGKLGITEDPPGSNRGPQIDQWLGRCGVSTGLPWCAAFASWCLDFVSTAGALALGQHFPATLDPYPGDVMYFPTGGGKGHCGLVLGVSPHEVMTIEGNCQDAVRVVRRARDLVRFGSIGNDLQGKCPEAVASLPFLATRIEGTR